MFPLKVAWKYLTSGGRFLNVTSSLSMIGMIIGVAALVVSMAVISGYESSLKKVVTDVVGDLIIVKRGYQFQDYEREIKNDLGAYVKDYTAMSPYMISEAVLAKKGKVNGVIIEGVEPDKVEKVLRLKERVIKGQFQFGESLGAPLALIGKGIAKKYDLSVGDRFRVAVPQVKGGDALKIKPKIQKFKVSGILNLGRFDYDSRYILTDLETVRKVNDSGQSATGVRIKLKDNSQAEEIAVSINSLEDSTYWARSWLGANRNLFEAIKYEKPIIFLVVLIIVLAASFNISSTLFVSVLKRYNDIGVLKTLGARRSFFLKVFSCQGLIIGFVGGLIGIVVGLGACEVFLWAHGKWGLLPEEVYKLNELTLEVRLKDLGLILLASMSICYLSTLAPARRGAKLNPVEGLKYE